MHEKIFFRIVAILFTYSFTAVVNFLLISKFTIGLYGIFVFSISLIQLFLIFIDLGFSQIYLQNNPDERFEEYFSVYFLFKLILLIGNFTLLIISSFFLNLEPLVFQFLIMITISFIFTHFAEIWVINLESKFKFIKRGITFVFEGILKNSLGLLIIINYASIANPLILLSQFYILSSILYLILVFILSKGEFQFKKINKEIMKKIFKATKPLILSSIVGVVVINIGNIILDVSYSHEELAYYYLIERQVITFLLLISIQILQIFLSYFPKEFEDNNLTNIKNTTHTAERYLSILFLSIIILTILNGRLIIKIFLPKYLNATIYLYILIFIPFFAGVNRPYTSHLIASKRQSLYTKYSIYRSIIYIFMVIILIPKYFFSIPMLGFGGIGLAYLSVSIWVIDAFYYRIISKRIGIPPQKGILLHLFLAGFAFFLVFFISRFFLRNFILNDFIYILITSSILLGIFLLELVLFRELDKKDLKFFLKLLRFSTYKDSLVDEIKQSKKISPIKQDS